MLAQLGKTMSDHVGIFRDREKLSQALNDIADLKEQYGRVGVSSVHRHMNYELMNAIELEYMLEVAHAIALGALRREESRGAHCRREFSLRNDEEWLKHSLIERGRDGDPLISYSDVTITKYQPRERTY